MRYSFTKEIAGETKTVEIEIDLGTLPEKTVAYAMARGLKEALQDTFAGAKTIAEFEAGLNKKADAIRSGDMPEFGQRAAGLPRDPLSEMIRRVATEKLRDVAKAKGKKLPKATEKEYGELVAAFTAANVDVFTAEAKKRLAAQAEIEVELPEGF